MKKTSRPQLALRTETVRPLVDKDLILAGGARAYNTNLTYYSFCVYTPTTGCWA
jgi:hypothetical protein